MIQPTPLTDQTTQPAPHTLTYTAMIKRLVVGTLLINLFAFTLAGLSITESRHQYQERAEITTQNLARVLEENIDGAVDKIDMSLLSVQDEVKRQIAGGGIDAGVLNAFLTQQQDHQPEILSLRATDAEGVVRYGRGVPPTGGPRNNDREYYLRARDETPSGLIVTKPVFTRLDKKWAIVLARRLSGPDGSFAGVVYANVALAHLGKTFSEIDVGPRGTVTLRDRDLGFVARHPPPPNLDQVIGSQASPELQIRVQSGLGSATYRAISPTLSDNVERTFTYRKLSDKPFYLVVGLALDDYFAVWRQEAARTAALTLLFLLTTLLSSWQIYRAWKRQIAATEVLAAQEDKFRTVADYTYDWEYWLGPNREIRYMSPSCKRVTGYSPEEFETDPELFSRIVLPADRNVIDDLLHDDLYHDEALVDFRIVRRDGSIRWITHGCRPVYGADGQFLGRRVSNRDNTERIEAEQKLLESELQLRLIIENEPECVKMVASDGTLLQMNRAGLNMIEADSADQVLGKQVSKIVEESFREAFDALTASAFRGESGSLEFRIRGLKGTTRWLDSHAVPMRNAQGDIVAALSVTRDITERKEVEEELKRSNAELEQFSYAISHDMRQPLRMISSYLQLLEKGLAGQLDAGKQEFFHFAIDGAKRLDQMLVGLLDYSRVGRKGEPPNWIESRTLLDEALLFLRPAIAEAQAELKIAGDWPRVFVSRDEMMRLLQNLIGNAVKYRVAGRKPEITVTSETVGNEWRLSVADNGVGILPDQAHRLFQVFQRLQSRAAYEGTGIGLALCRKIAERHGGRIAAESPGEDQGSTFRVALPLRREESATTVDRGKDGD